jgi:DNA-binding MarR family transcriptional regulator
MNEMQRQANPPSQAVPPCDAYELIQALMHAGRQIESQLDAALASAGLSAAKWNALRHLTEAGGHLMLSRLAGKLACVKSNATQLVDRLEAEKLVRRLPDAGDRRSIRAELTPEGRAAFARGQSVVTAFEQQLMDEYTPEEQDALRHLLARLSQGENRTVKLEQ